MAESLRLAAGIIQNFDAKGSDVGERWRKWKTNFEYFLEASKIKKESDKLSYLFALGGSDVQEIYKYATPHEDEVTVLRIPMIEIPVYRNCILRLDKHFKCDVNKIAAKTKFRSIKQSSDENFNSFLVRLQAQADRCKFGEAKDSEIILQISQNARHEKVREKALESKKLSKLIDYANNFEELQTLKNTRNLEKLENESGEANISAIKKGEGKQGKKFGNQSGGILGAGKIVKAYKSKPSTSTSNSGVCYRCGSFKHKADYAMCPAKNVECHQCKKKGHFQRMCKKDKKMTINELLTLDEDDEVNQ